MSTASSDRLPRLSPAVAETRLAVRQAFEDAALPAQSLILVALSGGPDSLALAAATAFEGEKAGLRVGAVIVDHGLQEQSAEVAKQAALVARELGLDPVVVKRVEVTEHQEGPESAARSARYAAFRRAAVETSAVRIFLGHTRDDQAEQVLLALARGSGSRSLAGIPPKRGLFVRPILGVSSETTAQACEDAGLKPWRDPHNDDPAYTRSRVRHRVLPMLEAELGPGIVDALARTAELAREDTEAFDEMINEIIEEIVEPAEAGIAVHSGALFANPAALRNRIIRYVAKAEFGVQLTRQHTLEVAKLVTDYKGQGALHLPGMRVKREGAYIVMSAAPGAEDHPRTIL